MAKNEFDLTESEIERRERIATLLLKEERVKSQMLENEKRQRDLDERAGAVCYIQTALSEFNRALSIFVEEIKALPVDLQAKINLVPEQYEKVEIYVRDMISRMHSNIRLNLESTVEVKAKAAEASAKNAAQAQKVKSKTTAKKSAGKKA